MGTFFTISLFLVTPMKRGHPASYPVGTRGSFPGSEADHSPASIAEVKNE